MKSLSTYYKAMLFLIYIYSVQLYSQTYRSTMIDPGHGGFAGAGAPSGCGPNEQVLNLEMGLDMWTYVMNDNANIFPYITRRLSDHSDGPTNDNRTVMANNDFHNQVDAYGASIEYDGTDYYYSIHCNAGSSTAFGSEVLYSSVCNHSPPIQNRLIRSKILSKFALHDHIFVTHDHHSGAISRIPGLKDRTDLEVLNKTKMPATILETEFITNYSLCQTVNNSNYWDDAGFAGLQTALALDIINHTYDIDNYITTDITSSATWGSETYNLIANDNSSEPVKEIIVKYGTLWLRSGSLTVLDNRIKLKVGIGGFINIETGAVIIYGKDAEIITSPTSIDETEKPHKLILYQNYPNPFNPTTVIHYDLPSESLVKLKVYNPLGQEVVTLVNGKEQAGYKSVTWNGKNQAGHIVGSGLYIYRLEAGGKIFSKKMLFMK